MSKNTSKTQDLRISLRDVLRYINNNTNNEFNLLQKEESIVTALGNGYLGKKSDQIFIAGGEDFKLAVLAYQISQLPQEERQHICTALTKVLNLKPNEATHDIFSNAPDSAIGLLRSEKVIKRDEHREGSETICFTDDFHTHYSTACGQTTPSLEKEIVVDGPLSRYELEIALLPFINQETPKLQPSKQETNKEERGKKEGEGKAYETVEPHLNTIFKTPHVLLQSKNQDKFNKLKKKKEKKDLFSTKSEQAPNSISDDESSDLPVFDTNNSITDPLPQNNMPPTNGGTPTTHIRDLKKYGTFAADDYEGLPAVDDLTTTPVDQTSATKPSTSQPLKAPNRPAPNLKITGGLGNHRNRGKQTTSILGNGQQKPSISTTPSNQLKPTHNELKRQLFLKRSKHPEYLQSGFDFATNNLRSSGTWSSQDLPIFSDTNQSSPNNTVGNTPTKPAVPEKPKGMMVKKPSVTITPTNGSLKAPSYAAPTPDSKNPKTTTSTPNNQVNGHSSSSSSTVITSTPVSIKDPTTGGIRKLPNQLGKNHQTKPDAQKRLFNDTGTKRRPSLENIFSPQPPVTSNGQNSPTNTSTSNLNHSSSSLSFAEVASSKVLELGKTVRNYIKEENTPPVYDILEDLLIEQKKINAELSGTRKSYYGKDTKGMGEKVKLGQSQDVIGKAITLLIENESKKITEKFNAIISSTKIEDVNFCKITGFNNTSKADFLKKLQEVVESDPEIKKQILSHTETTKQLPELAVWKLYVTDKHIEKTKTELKLDFYFNKIASHSVGQQIGFNQQSKQIFLQELEKIVRIDHPTAIDWKEKFTGKHVEALIRKRHEEANKKELLTKSQNIIQPLITEQQIDAKDIIEAAERSNFLKETTLQQGTAQESFLGLIGCARQQEKKINENYKRQFSSSTLPESEVKDAFLAAGNTQFVKQYAWSTPEQTLEAEWESFKETLVKVKGEKIYTNLLNTSSSHSSSDDFGTPPKSPPPAVPNNRAVSGPYGQSIFRNHDPYMSQHKSSGSSQSSATSSSSSDSTSTVNSEGMTTPPAEPEKKEDDQQLNQPNNPSWVNRHIKEAEGFINQTVRVMINDIFHDEHKRDWVKRALRVVESKNGQGK